MTLRQPIPQIPKVGDSGLVGAWANRSVASSGKDSSVSAADMIANGKPTFTRYGVGPISATDYLEYLATDYRGADAVGSICGWFKTPAAGTTQVLLASSDTAAGIDYVQLRITSSKLEWQTRRSSISRVTGSTTIKSDTWYFVCATSNGSRYQIFLNAMPETLTPDLQGDTGNWFDTPTDRNNVTIGCLLNDSGVLSPWLGELEDWRVYSRELTRSEITAIFRAGVPDDSLVASWLNGGHLEDMTRYRYNLDMVGSVPLTRRGAGPFTTTSYIRGVTGGAGDKFDQWRNGDAVGTFAAWVKTPNVTTDQYILSTSNEAGTIDYLFFSLNDDGKLWAASRRSVNHVVASSLTLTLDKWHFVSVSSNGSRFLFTVDGVEAITEVVTGDDNGHWLDFPTSRDNVCLGILRRNSSTGSGPWLGELADVHYYPVEQTTKQLKQYRERTLNFY